MAKTEVSFRINDSVVNTILRGPHGPIAKELLRRALKVEALAKRKCPVAHGRLRNSIHTELVTNGNSDKPMSARIHADVYYARFVHDGTGQFGPHPHQIFPRTKEFMVWATSDNHLIFAQSTKGMKGTPFLTDALKEVMHSG